MATFTNTVPNNVDFYWYSQNKLFLLFLVTKRNFIPVTLSQQRFQTLRGGKKCLRYFYPYLANPYGFSLQQKTLLPPIVQALEDLGAEVWEPFERNNQIDLSQPGWAYRVAQADMNDVKNCDAIFAIVNGIPPDEGVMIELGIAIAYSKAVFLFRDDFRRCTDSEHYPLNLMLFCGLPEVGWEDYYYTSLEDIKSQKKALYTWLTNN